MQAHAGASELQGGACGVLLNLAEREKHRWKIESGGIGMVAAAMQRHCQDIRDEEVLEQGCQALSGSRRPASASREDLRPHVLAASGRDAAALAASYAPPGGGGCGRAQKMGRMLQEVLAVAC
ncbi:unnamed protein product [Prorocentrum cordatum]|uniref:Uncharacterized protein n=1 Tax=Prorocentrum cordatum TaxID=2364126 RepID=A0ABN9VDM4_9DINO|nr:unnamed protein product [Polarella glacialis]